MMNRAVRHLALKKLELFLQKDSAFVAGAVSDINGFFSIPQLGQGKFILVINSYKFDPIYDNIEIDKPSGIINKKYYLEKKSSIQDLGPVTVSAEKQNKKN